jgi:hypothetical protein
MTAEIHHEISITIIDTEIPAERLWAQKNRADFHTGAVFVFA